jgi:hypothetical protein
MMIDVGVEGHGPNFGSLVMDPCDFKMNKTKLGISI